MSMAQTENTESKIGASAAAWQTKQPIFWLLIVLLAATALLLVIELVRIGTNVAAMSAALVLLGIQALAFWLIVRVMPRFKRQPRSLKLVALLWGLIIACTLAGLANTFAAPVWMNLGLGTFSASLVAPINEDILRLLGVLAVLSLAHARSITVMDGAVYGFIVGAGFELNENLFYAVSKSEFSETISVGLARLFVGFGLHALWTTLAGAALAYCLMRLRRGEAARWWVLIPGVGIPMLLHAAWDAPALSLLSILKMLSFIALYIITLAAFLFATGWGRRSEFAWFAKQGGAPADFAQFKRLPRAERRRLAAQAVGPESRS